jgi:hypothetical protein
MSDMAIYRQVRKQRSHAGRTIIGMFLAGTG